MTFRTVTTAPQDVRLSNRAATPASQAVRIAFLAALAGALFYFVRLSLHWPMLVDSPVMHYVTFLTEHGLRPYRDITDNNMPGAYIAERAAMFVFGPTDFGWRLYDFALLAAMMACMVVIARPYDWLAGVFAAGLFALRHGSEGAWFAAEREEMMAVLLVAACAFLFLALRQQRPAWALVFGCLTGAACSIKPTLLPFALLALLLAAWPRHRGQRTQGKLLLWGFVGLTAAGLLDLLFLVHYHVLASFWFVLHTVTPLYASLNHPGRSFLLAHLAPYAYVPLAGCAIVAFAMNRSWNREFSILLLGAVCGLLSYFLQGKGFYHHRYIFLTFALLLMGLLLVPITRQHGNMRWLGCLVLLYSTTFLIPRELQAMRRLPPGPSALTGAMEADLTTLSAGRSLQHGVQCFDLTFGCLNSLYHLGLVENTGFTGDLLLFAPTDNPATAHYRAMFWRAQQANPARVIIVTNQDFGQENSFARLPLWPQFAAYLAAHYELAATRVFPYEDRFRGQPPWPAGTSPAYRVYLRRDDTSPALPKEAP